MCSTINCPEERSPGLSKRLFSGRGVFGKRLITDRVFHIEGRYRGCLLSRWGGDFWLDTPTDLEWDVFALLCLGNRRDQWDDEKNPVTATGGMLETWD